MVVTISGSSEAGVSASVYAADNATIRPRCDVVELFKTCLLFPYYGFRNLYRV